MATFFPNLPAETMAHERKLRLAVAALGEAERIDVYESLTALSAGLVRTGFAIDGDMILARQKGAEIAFPRPLPLIKFSHLACGYEAWLHRKYALPDFLKVEPGDVVIDCGGYVGGFSLSAARIARQVHLFEPERRNAACARRNLAHFPNVIVNEAGLYDRSGAASLNISSSSVEHSLLNPDDGAAVGVAEIRIETVHNYCGRLALVAPDFLKVEAEGVEIEVIRGLGDLRPRKIAVDVSPERDGKSPALEIGSMLSDWGYEIRRRGNVLFAKRMRHE